MFLYSCSLNQIKNNNKLILNLILKVTMATVKVSWFPLPSVTKTIWVWIIDKYLRFKDSKCLC